MAAPGLSGWHWQLVLEIAARWLGSQPQLTPRTNGEWLKLVMVPAPAHCQARFWGGGFALADTEGRYWKWGIFGRRMCCIASRTSVTDTQPHLFSFTLLPSIIYGQDGLVWLAYT